MTPRQGTRLPALFLVALLGLLVAGAVAVSPLGWAGLTPYLLVVLALVVLLVRRARALAEQQAPATDAGRTCTCCTSTVHDPVEVR